MAEENKNIRLSKAAKEFNIGISTIVDFLLKKGHTVESNPNTKISDTMYELLLKEFQSEKHVKEEAQKIGLEFANRQSLSIESLEKEKHQHDEDHHQETHVKNILSSENFKKTEPITPTKEVVQQLTVETPQVEIIEEVVIEPILEISIIAETPIIPVQQHREEIVEVVEKEIVEIKEDIIVSILETKHEDTVPLKEEIIQSEVTPDSENKIKVVGMLDLSKINLKTKPDKKSKAEKEKEKEQKKVSFKSDKQQEILKEEIVEATTIIVEFEKEPIQIKEEILDTKDATQDNFIQTKYTKLEGPKIQGKIDLSEFNKPQVKKQPVASSSEKHTDKKRPRIIEKNKAIENINALNKKPDAQKSNVVRHKVKEETKGKKKSEFKITKAVVDDNAIEKQIKETLARMNPLGKSKTSKYRKEKRSQVSQQFQDDQQKQLEEKKIIKVTEFVTANE